MAQTQKVNTNLLALTTAFVKWLIFFFLKIIITFKKKFLPTLGRVVFDQII